MTVRHFLSALAALCLFQSLHAEEAKPVDATPKLAHGQMMKQGEKLIFVPCRDRSYLLLEDVSSDGRVIKALDMVGLSSGKKLYVEVLAVLDGGALKASEINFAKSEGRCQLPGGREESWRAAGNEPGWLLAVGDEVVQLKRLGQPDVVLPSAPVKRENGMASLDIARDNQQLSLHFEQKLCRDTMADDVFGWTATVRLNGQTLRGCAWLR